ncbi:hypothetical protein BUALT_Bualt11G0117300 [Buddleja alternifolia]|uniref:Myb-like domain-containing protein n=1 Tax=Buddleja alternifolia TaxID=168488 RepID=A0AAV6X2D2_9LAMI|nr:hypothetical protein BUALT_Bualt11G0117300 [Buddleja alternifolia]
MSSDAIATAGAVVTVAEPVQKAPRRFPPPCWTQEETLALIEAYRERWYALRRGYLRTADWDAVAAAVASRCPGASPAKTSAQCRHKMEKLRQRYRAEKQRALSYPYPAGRYFSTWFFFENMEAMENGTTPPTSNQNPDNSGDGSSLKSFLDQNILKLKLKASNNADLNPDLGFDHGVKVKRSRSEIEMEAFDDEDVVDLERRKAMNGVSRPNLKSKSKSKNSSKMFDVSDGYHQSMLPPGSRSKIIGKFDSNNNTNNNNPHFNEEFWVKVSNTNNDSNYNSNTSSAAAAAPGYRAKCWASLNPRPDSRPMNRGGRSAVEEIVASIKLLGEGFVKVESAKMEMAREMEEMRMEMEMKRNEMLLQSQKQIVDAFVKGLVEMKKNKKVKTDHVVAAENN